MGVQYGVIRNFNFITEGFIAERISFMHRDNSVFNMRNY